MYRFHITPAQADAAIRAMHAVSLADGALEEHEVALLRASARALGVAYPAEGGPGPVEPAEILALDPDPVARLRLIQAMELMALMDGKVTAEEIALIERFARTLGVDDPRLGTLRGLLRGRLRLVQMDLLRRSPMNSMMETVYAKRGLLATLRWLVEPQGWASADPELAWRYKQLGLLPEGSFGREYWAHMTVRKFPFPGEPHGFPEELVRHDLSHVLSGYDTDVPGECQNAAFLSASLREDPFSYLFMVAVHCHLDVEVFPNDPSQAFMGFDPEKVIPALARGAQVNRDLYDLSWDFWQDFPRPIAEVRAEFGVPPMN